MSINKVVMTYEVMRGFWGLKLKNKQVNFVKHKHNG